MIGRALLAVLAATAVAVAQEVDWDDAVHKTVEHRRYAVRRAAAGKIARAGDDAVPAILEFEENAGRAAIPLLLIDAIARSTAGGEATVGMLESWATDREFYWRSQALGGLARREVEHLLPHFLDGLTDASQLFRTAAARGVLAVGGLAVDDAEANRDRVRALLADVDPRARLRVALMLLEAGDPAGVGQIVDATDRADWSFLDDRWGAREAVFALRELKRITGDDRTAALGESGDERLAAQEALRAWARGRLNGYQPTPRRVASLDAVGGVEVRSCRNGDLYLRWTADGTVFLGLDPLRRTRIDPERFAALQAGLPALAGVATHGEVICDFVRLYVPADEADRRVHHKAAPSALPGPIHEWLKSLAAALDDSKERALLESRLEQFVATEKGP